MVRFVAVDGSDCDRIVVEDPEDSTIEAGVDVGRICVHCQQVDEDAAEIYHDDDCPLAGEGGRRLFTQLDTSGPTPELRPEHQIDILRSSTTTMRHDLRRGEPFAFRCGACGVCDETLRECWHDAWCPLAGVHGRQTVEAARRRAATDGGHK